MREKEKERDGVVREREKENYLLYIWVGGEVGVITDSYSSAVSQEEVT